MATPDGLTPDTRCFVCWDGRRTETLAEFRVKVCQPQRITWDLPMCPAHAAYTLANPRPGDVVILYPLP